MRRARLGQSRRWLGGLAVVIVAGSLGHLGTTHALFSDTATVENAAGTSGWVGNEDRSEYLICHSTGNERNPWNLIRISPNGVNGHRHHTHPDDIIPAPDGAESDADCELSEDPGTKKLESITEGDTVDGQPPQVDPAVVEPSPTPTATAVPTPIPAVQPSDTPAPTLVETPTPAPTAAPTSAPEAADEEPIDPSAPPAP